MGIVLNFDENEVTKASVAMHGLISVHRRIRQEATLGYTAITFSHNK